MRTCDHGNIDVSLSLSLSLSLLDFMFTFLILLRLASCNFLAPGQYTLCFLKSYSDTTWSSEFLGNDSTFQDLRQTEPVFALGYQSLVDERCQSGAFPR